MQEGLSDPPPLYEYYCHFCASTLTFCLVVSKSLPCLCVHFPILMVLPPSSFVAYHSTFVHIPVLALLSHSTFEFHSVPQQMCLRADIHDNLVGIWRSRGHTVYSPPCLPVIAECLSNNTRSHYTVLIYRFAVCFRVFLLWRFCKCVEFPILPASTILSPWCCCLMFWCDFQILPLQGTINYTLVVLTESRWNRHHDNYEAIGLAVP
jgi:hypothetical protein